MTLKMKIIFMFLAVSVAGGCRARTDVKDAPLLPAEVVNAPQSVTDKNYRPMTMVERYVQKAALLVNSGKIKEAVETLEMALLIDPTNEDAHALLERLRPGRKKKELKPVVVPEKKEEKKIEAKPVEAVAEKPVEEKKEVPAAPVVEVEKEVPVKVKSKTVASAKPVEPTTPEPVPAAAPEVSVAKVEVKEPVQNKLKGKEFDSLQVKGLEGTEDMPIDEFAHKIMEEDFVFNEVTDDITKYIYKEYLHERAVEVYLQAIKRFPDSPNVPKALLYIGMFYKQKEKYDKALEYLERILKNHARADEICAFAKYEIAEILFMRKEYKRAYGILTDILNTSVTYALLGHVYMLRGRVMAAMGEWKKGLSDYQAVIKLGRHTKQFENAVIAVARELIKHGRPDEAVSHLEFYMDKANVQGKGRVAMLLASVYHDAGDTVGEKRIILDFLAMPKIERKDRVRAMYMLGDCFFRLEDWENAYNTYNTALKEYYAKSKAIGALYRKGLCASRIGFYKDALSSFGDVIARTSYSPEWVRSKFERSVIFRKQANNTAAAQDLKDVITFARDEKLVLKAYKGLGALFSAQGRAKDAAFLYEKALSNFKDNPEAILTLKIELAQALKDSGKAEKALEIIRSVDGNEFSRPGNELYFRYKDVLAGLLFENAYYAKSLETYEELRSNLDSDDSRVPALMYAMGRCRELMGEKKEAVEAYNELIRTYPASVASEQAQWNIKNIKWQADYAARESM